MLILLTYLPILNAEESYYSFPDGSKMNTEKFSKVLSKITSILKLPCAGYMLRNLMKLAGEDKPHVSDRDIRDLELKGLWKSNDPSFNASIINVLLIAIRITHQHGGITFNPRNPNEYSHMFFSS